MSKEDVLFGNFGEGDAEVTLNDQPYNLYDADTVLTEGDEQSHRLLDIDAPEYPKITDTGFKSPQLFAEDYRDVVETAINEEGFNRLVPTGEEDIYDRSLSEVQDPSGLNLGVDLTQRGLIPPSRYSIDSPQIGLADTKAALDTQLYIESTLPAWKQIENSLSARMAQDKLNQELDVETLPSMFQSTTTTEEPDSQVVDAVQMWWYQNVGAYEGIKALAGIESGYAGMDQVERDIQENIDPNTVFSLEQVEDAGDLFSFFRNALITEGIDYGILAAGAGAGTAVGGPVGGFIGGTLALGYNFLKSTGNVAQEQYGVTGEVDPGEALFLGTAITALDKLSVGVKISPYSVLSKQGLEDAAKVVAKSNNITEKEAAKLIKTYTADEIRRTANALGIKATSIATSRDITMSMLKGLAYKGGAEGGTELTQEMLQALTINGLPKTDKEWQELGWRAADAFTAGAGVGTVYSVGSSLQQRYQIESLQDDIISEYDPKRSSTNTKLYMGARQSVQEDHSTLEAESIINEFRDGNQKTALEVQGDSIEERAEKARVSNYVGSALAKISRGEYTPGLSAIWNTFKGKLYDKKGRVNSLPLVMAEIEGATQALIGDSLYNIEQSNLGQLSINHKWLNNLEHLGVTVDQFNSIVNTLSNNFFRVDSLPEADREAGEKVRAGLLRLTAEIIKGYQDAGATPDILAKLKDKGIKGILLENNLPDTQKIQDNYQDFIGRLAELSFNTGKRDGQKVGDNLAEKIATQLFDGDFGWAMERLSEVNAKENLADYFPKNDYEAVLNKAMREVVYTTRARYRGFNNQTYSNMLNAAVKRGQLTDEQANELAFDLMQQIEKHNNSFGKLKNKTLSNIQDVARTATSFGLMDNVLFSQLGEAMMAFIGTNKPLASQLSSIAKNFAESFSSSLPIIKKRRERQEKERMDTGQYTYRDLLKASGYSPAELIQQQGANLDNAFLRKLQSKFYKIVLLEQATDTFRLTRMVAAQDSFDQIVEELINADFSNLTQNQAKHAARLASYGIDVERVVKLYKDSEKHRFTNIGTLSPDDPAYSTVKELESIWMKALPKFVDEFTVRVKPGSRPTIFEDQRFGLPFLTQYLSFISHFHANQLPKLYQDYLAKATTKVAYATFQQMALAITAAYVSQYLKDLLLKGELHPSLKDGGDIQRAIDYSGLTGHGQNIIDMTIDNAYGMETDAMDVLLGSPTVSHLGRVAGKIAEGDYVGAAQQAIPFGDLTKEEAATRRLFDMIIGNNQ